MTSFDFYGIVSDADGRISRLRCPTTDADFRAAFTSCVETLFLVAQDQGLKCPMRIERFELVRKGRALTEIDWRKMCDADICELACLFQSLHTVTCVKEVDHDRAAGISSRISDILSENHR